MFVRFFLRNSDTFLLVLVGASWQFLTHSPLTVRMALVLAGICVTLRVLHTLRAFEKSGADDGNGLKSERARVFVEDPDAVLDLAKLDGFDYVKRSKDYVGKWTVISGSYEGATRSLEGNAIHLSLLLNGGQRVNLRFQADRGEQLRGLRVGQRVSAIGQIPIAGDVFLPENCELVRDEPARVFVPLHSSVC